MKSIIDSAYLSLKILENLQDLWNLINYYYLGLTI